MNKMSSKTNETSLQVYARTGGVLYLIMIILGIINELVVRRGIIVSGDVAVTAANLKSSESLWRFGVAIEIIMVIITIFLALVMYVLTKPVNKNIALLAAFFNLVALTMQATYSLQLLEALFPVGGAEYLKSFTPEQLYAIANMTLKSHGLGFGICLLMFGPFFILTGYLIIKSGYFPKLIGILYLIPGVSYFVSSFVVILAPQFGEKYYFFMAGPALIGELSLSLWLILKGVNLDKWRFMQKSPI